MTDALFETPVTDNAGQPAAATGHTSSEPPNPMLGSEDTNVPPDVAADGTSGAVVTGGNPAAIAPTPRVCGLDLSLTATGVSDGHYVSTLRTKASKDATLVQRHARLDKLRELIVAYCMDADLVVVEQPAYASATGHMHDRSGLWWLVVNGLLSLDIPVAEVIPQHVKMYATGKGVGSKDTVMAAAIRRYPDVAIANNNEADGHILAAMGLRHLGHPIDDLPLTHLRAMDRVAWPVIT